VPQPSGQLDEGFGHPRKTIEPPQPAAVVQRPPSSAALTSASARAF
jgi:hypothetical protein